MLSLMVASTNRILQSLGYPVDLAATRRTLGDFGIYSVMGEVSMVEYVPAF